MKNPFVASLVPSTQKSKDFDLGLGAGGLRKLRDVEVPEYFYNRYSFNKPILNSLINGDGLMKSQVISVASPRGGGKSTFLMSALQSLTEANPGLKCAYFSNEECIEQLAFTATRIGALDVMADNVSDIDTIAEHMKALNVLVIDSFPGLSHDEMTAPALVERYAINTLIKTAKTTGCSLFVIMHYTKSGMEAGSKNLYHAVDTCISISKLDSEDYGENCRMIEVTKNRFGSASEVILRMTKNGFDFNDPVSEKNTNDAPGATGVYIKAKKNDTMAIMRVIRDQDATGGAKLADFGKLDIDMGRVERLLKELCSRGVAVQSGGGKGQSKDSKRWHLGDVDEDFFDEETTDE